MTDTGGVAHPPAIPRATYRLQLTPAFDFAAAARAIPYLRELGISHLYLSPMWEAAAGSTHGYDVIDHARVREELGGLAGYLALAAAARDAGLGIIVDIVPNHVSVADGRHEWWRDVLRFGQRSEFAPYFDIDWSGRGETPPGILVVPVLGEPFGVVLEDGDFRLAFDGREFVIEYAEGSYPCRPDCYSEILGIPPPELFAADEPAMSSAVTAVEQMLTAEPAAARALLTGLAEAAGRSNAVAEWIEGRVHALNDPAPEARSSLDRIVSGQHFRLASWRVAPEQINYRRFFDVNSLAGLRMEYEPAFEATHALLFQLCAQGLVQGIRVDHVDGLSDPAGYLAALRQRTSGIPIWIEKILASDETLAPWPVEGTTGYDFLGSAGRLFLAPEGLDILDGVYQQTGGTAVSPAVLSYQARYAIADRGFDGDVAGLTHELVMLAQASPRHRDLTRRSLREALTAILASMPRYRTYLPAPDREAQLAPLRRAASAALARGTGVAPEAVAFIEDVLLTEHDAAVDTRAAAFVLRFQQLSSAVMAKGMEDTAFFRYARLLSQNEVGSDFSRWDMPLGEMHGWLSKRGGDRPHTLNATSTHDTKRSEDARMRLAVLSEFASEWADEVRTWRALNSALVQRTDDGWFPPPASEYYLYQTLVATWEPGGFDGDYARRISEHMTKASREAKLWTSWVRPNEPGEAALADFIVNLLDRGRDSQFLSRLDAFVRRIEPHALQNSRSLCALKLLAPGLPDIYQGAETWLFTLTDPDNRRAVNFEAMQRRLAARPPAGAMGKLRLVAGLLALRRALPHVFLDGAYTPLQVKGALEGRCFAFERAAGERRVLTVLPIRTAGMLDDGGTLRREVVAGSVLETEPACWHDVLDPQRKGVGPLDGLVQHGLSVCWA